MSRFEDLLNILSSEMHLRLEYHGEKYGKYRACFDAWKSEQYKLDPVRTMIDRIGDRNDLAEVWAVWSVCLLWHDHFLEIPLWHDDRSPWAFEWHDVTREALARRAHDSQELVKFIAAHFWSLREAHEATQDPDFLTTHPAEMQRVPFSERLWEWYKQTKLFFGHTFQPLMEAYKQYEDGVPEQPLYPLMNDGETGRIAVSEVNHLVIKHLGIPGYSALAGKKRLSNAQERIAVTLDSYSGEDRERVASCLMARHKSRVDVQLALCELALRRILPVGHYLLQPDEVGKHVSASPIR